MKLYLGSYFAFFTPGRHHWVEVEIPHPTRLTDILSEIGVPAAEVHLVVVNDQALETTNTLVSNDDTVRLYPAIGGGLK
jgi:sulfur carrier protein ThiS